MHSSRFSLFLTGGQVLSHVRADGMSEPMELSSQMESAVAELPKPRVLLVDNDGTSRASSATALRSAGLEVIEARDAEEGFAMARSEQPNLIVCDLKPETAGLIRSLDQDDSPIMFAYPASS
jgi:PleD family two-component response regulator